MRNLLEQSEEHYFYQKEEVILFSTLELFVLNTVSKGIITSFGFARVVADIKGSLLQSLIHQ